MINNEALKAFKDAFHGGTPKSYDETIREGLAAAVPYLSAPCAVEVKVPDTLELIKALSRLAGNRHSDGVSSLVSAEDRSSIIDGCYALMIAAKAAKPVDVAEARSSAALDEINKFVTWFDRFICNQDELNSSTPRKVAQNAKDASVELKEAIRTLSAEPAQGGYTVADELRDLRQSILLSKTLADFNAVKKTAEALTAPTTGASK